MHFDGLDFLDLCESYIEFFEVPVQNSIFYLWIEKGLIIHNRYTALLILESVFACDLYLYPCIISLSGSNVGALDLLLYAYSICVHA